MDTRAKLTRAARINVIAGSLSLAASAVMLGLVAVGLRPMDTGLAVSLVFASVIAALAFLSARGLWQDRDDPAGIERRFRSQAVAWSAGLLLFGLLVVVVVIVWGVLR